MAKRISTKQSEHDAAVKAASQIYRQDGKTVSINPGSEQNESWSGRYIDVIAKDSSASSTAWVTEVETEDSISEAEAREQWVDYDNVYTQAWHLAVPVGTENDAKELIGRYGIKHCRIITWRRNNDGTHTFWGLPGISG